VNRITGRRPLGRRDLGALRNRLRFRGLSLANRRFLRNSWWGWQRGFWARNWFTRFGLWGGPRFFPYIPGGATIVGGLDLADVPGIDPEAPAAVFPAIDGGDPGAGSIIAAVDPETIEPVDITDGGEEEPSIPGPEVEETPDEPDNLPAVPDDDGEPVANVPLPAASVLQTTRNVRFSNPTNKKVKVKLYYQTTDIEDNAVWPTGRPGDAEAKPVEVEVEPGEVAEVTEGDWTVNANRISFTAETDDGEQKWEQFKDQELNLVPEETDGAEGYAAPNVQAITLAFK
jgi:hypothetical protein